MNDTDVGERLRQMEESLTALVLLVMQLVRQQQTQARTDHDGVGRGGGREEARHDRMQGL